MHHRRYLTCLSVSDIDCYGPIFWDFRKVLWTYLPKSIVSPGSMLNHLIYLLPVHALLSQALSAHGCILDILIMTRISPHISLHAVTLCIQSNKWFVMYFSYVHAKTTIIPLNAYCPTPVLIPSLHFEAFKNGYIGQFTTTSLSTAIGLWKHRIPSDLRS